MEKILKKAGKPVFTIWIMSVLCYLPFIAKGLTNSVDGLWASSYYQAGNIELGSGRWFLLFLDKGRGAYGAEPFSTFFALFFVSLATYIAITMFTEAGYKNAIIAVLAPCSSTMCCILAYRFTSANYGLSILLSVVAAWVLTRDVEGKNNRIKQVIIAIAIMIFSLGIYQANLGCFCVPIILYMMKMLLDGENEKCFRIFRNTVIVGISSCILYKIAWDICLKARGITASDYNGADSVSLGGAILGLPKSLTLIYKFWFSFFKGNHGYYVFNPIRTLIIIFIFAVVIGLGVKKLKGNPKRLVIYLLLLLCLPVGANIAVILAPSTKAIILQMTAPMMLVIPLVLFYLDGQNLVKLEKILFVLGAMLLYGNVIAVGADEDALNQGSNTTYAIMNNIVTSLNEKELLGGDYTYAFYGNPAENELFQVNDMYSYANKYARFGTLQTKPDMVHNAYDGLLDDIGINLETVDYDTYREVLESDVLDSMPTYPAEGSISEKDGVVIIKVSDDYKWE